MFINNSYIFIKINIQLIKYTSINTQKNPINISKQKQRNSKGRASHTNTEPYP